MAPSSAVEESEVFEVYEMRWCGSCGDERGFEAPPCEDGHGLDCLDLACVECGHAIVVGIMTSDDVVLVQHLAA